MPKLFSYRGKHLISAVEYGFARMVAPVCLAMALSLTGFVGCSWAWFQANRSVGVAAIEAASVFVGATVTREVPLSAAVEADAVGDTELNGAFTFIAESNTRYLLNLSREGTAQSGYLSIQTPVGMYFSRERELQILMLLPESGAVTITADWGYVPDDAVEVVRGQVIGTGDSYAMGNVTLDCTGLEHVTVYIGTDYDNIMEAGDADYIPGKSFIWFMPHEGYVMPGMLHVKIGERDYTVYTDGRVEGVTEMRPAYSHVMHTMDIPVELLEGVTSVIITPGTA